jgi:hypothetical protein
MVTTWSLVHYVDSAWSIPTISGTLCKMLPRNKANNKYIRPAWYDDNKQPSDKTKVPSYLDGKLIVRDVMQPASMPTGKKLGSQLTTPVVDTDAREALWYTLVDKTAADYAAELVANKASLKVQIADRRWEVETGGIIRNGVAVATDLKSQSKLSGALQLVQAKPSTVIRWSGTDAWVGMNAATVAYLATEVGLHIQAAFVNQEILENAVDNAANDAELALINVEEGSVNNVGSWTSNGA